MIEKLTDSAETRAARNRAVIDMHEDGKTNYEIAVHFQLSVRRVEKIIEIYDYEELDPQPVIMRDRKCSLCRKPMKLPQYVFTCSTCKLSDVY
jgi:transposase